MKSESSGFFLSAFANLDYLQRIYTSIHLSISGCYVFSLQLSCYILKVLWVSS